jgi:chromosome segregation ATPase
MSDPRDEFIEFLKETLEAEKNRTDRCLKMVDQLRSVITEQDKLISGWKAAYEKEAWTNDENWKMIKRQEEKLREFHQEIENKNKKIEELKNQIEVLKEAIVEEGEEWKKDKKPCHPEDDPNFKV